jgi:formate hydrogenlyase subunit 3/multisubunit Na+/H+ antiporter MnhD subunit
MVLVRIAAGALLVAHGLVHLLYLADLPEFSTDRSWLVPAPSRRPVGFGLVGATITAFVILALAVWGLPVLSGTWSCFMAVASLLSMVLLILFGHRWLIVGLAIDVGLLVIAVIRPEWAERLMS